MRLTVDRQEQEFREQVRTWLAENRPRESPPPHGPQRRAFDMAWQRTQWGTPEFCEVFYDEVRVPLSNVVGDNIIGERLLGLPKP